MFLLLSFESHRKRNAEETRTQREIQRQQYIQPPSLLRKISDLLVPSSNVWNTKSWARERPESRNSVHVFHMVDVDSGVWNIAHCYPSWALQENKIENGTCTYTQTDMKPKRLKQHLNHNANYCGDFLHLHTVIILFKFSANC